jgi:SAM-dependent methyltransferase
MPKDYFSGHSRVYATFRPTYPEDLYSFIFQHVPQKDTAWDCATGNGQVASYLAEYFDRVFATDISAQQLEQAPAHEGVVYAVSPAEHTLFPDNQFDLITVGQALHWFDRNAFYTEVKRVAKPGAILAVWGYATMSVTPEIDGLLLHFYNNIVGPYWDDARRLVEQQYKTIEFPFEEIPAPAFAIRVAWSLEHLAGYLESWSATQKYMREKGVNPVPDLIKTLAPLWPDDLQHTVSFPVFVRLGRVVK